MEPAHERHSLAAAPRTIADVDPFVWDGIVQLRNPGGTAQYFASAHVPVPNVAVWISIPVHLLGGLALLAGFYSRWAATLLVLVCLGTAFGVHLPAGDQHNMIHFYRTW
jgi:putative oxidoreductase